jgi:hypothetical protein
MMIMLLAWSGGGVVGRHIIPGKPAMDGNAKRGWPAANSLSVGGLSFITLTCGAVVEFKKVVFFDFFGEEKGRLQEKSSLLLPLPAR